jgi:putative acyl-CoA dehydrogenase
MRLKDKIGDRSNASSEVEYDDAYGTMLGEEGKGVKTIIDMVQSTRLDCILGSAGG